MFTFHKAESLQTTWELKKLINIEPKTIKVVARGPQLQPQALNPGELEHEYV